MDVFGGKIIAIGYVCSTFKLFYVRDETISPVIHWWGRFEFITKWAPVPVSIVILRVSVFCDCQKPWVRIQVQLDETFHYMKPVYRVFFSSCPMLLIVESVSPTIGDGVVYFPRILSEINQWSHLGFTKDLGIEVRREKTVKTFSIGSSSRRIYSESCQ